MMIVKEVIRKVTEKEIRLLKSPIEMRSLEDGSDVIEGYALKFNTWSEDFGWFRESISPDSLENTDMSDVVALYNHEDSQLIGRSGVNLELEVDNIGLKYTIKPVDTTASRDLIENIRSGLITQSSFAMSNIEDDWEETEKRGYYDRTIRSIGKLWDVSPVVRPAYKDTDVSVNQRSLDKVQDLKKHDKDDLELLDIEMSLYT